MSPRPNYTHSRARRVREKQTTYCSPIRILLLAGLKLEAAHSECPFQHQAIITATRAIGLRERKSIPASRQKISCYRLHMREYAQQR